MHTGRTDYHPVSFNRSVLSHLFLAILGTSLCVMPPVKAYPAGAPKTIDLGPYNTIVAKDPFDPERGKNRQEDLGNQSNSSNDLKKRYQVYGIIVAGNNRRAYLRAMEPDETPRRGRYKKPRYRVLSIGDLVDGWKVVSISSSGIKLVSGDKDAFLRVFGSEKKERKAIAPVVIQTPQPVNPIPVPAATSTSSAKARPTNPSQKRKPVVIRPKFYHGVAPPVSRSRTRATTPGIQPDRSHSTKGSTTSRSIPGFFGGNTQNNSVKGSPAPISNPFLKLLQRSREQQRPADD